MCLGALRGEHSLKVARSARTVQKFPHGVAVCLFCARAVGPEEAQALLRAAAKDIAKHLAGVVVQAYTPSRFA